LRRGLIDGAALPYLLILPALLLECVFVLYPIMRGSLVSLENFDGSIGLDNYRYMWSDPDFWRMLGHTLTYTLTVDVLVLTVALAVALLMNWSFPGRGVVRSILTVPWAIPDVPVAIAFVFMLDPSFGVFNRLVRLLPFVDQNPNWLLDPTLAMAAGIIVTVWKGFPFYSLVLLAALQNVPDELYDAARVDGAGPIGQFLHVTIPGIRDTIALLAVLAFIFATQQFTLIWLITGGGPVDATTTLAPAIYMQAFRFYNFGYAGAIAVVGFFISALATIAFIFIQRRLAREQ